jgi:hypothetical protein
MGPIAGKNERMNREHREPSLWKAQIEEIAYRHIGIEEERRDQIAHMDSSALNSFVKFA